MKLIDAINVDNVEAESILKEAINTNPYHFNVNYKNDKGRYPLMCCCFNDNIKILKLLIEYAEKYNVKLIMNERNNNNANTILLDYEHNNSIEFIKLLIDYANRNHIVIDINARDRDGDHSLVWSIVYNNVERAKILFDYAKKNQCKIDFI